MLCNCIISEVGYKYDHQFAMSPNIVRGLEEYNRMVPSANVLIVAFSNQLGISFTFINMKA